MSFAAVEWSCVVGREAAIVAAHVIENAVWELAMAVDACVGGPDSAASRLLSVVCVSYVPMEG